MEEIIFSDTHQNRLLGNLSIPEKPRGVVILSHGFSSNKDSKLYVELEHELNNAGIGTLRYEYYGHGKLFGYGSGYGVSKDVTLSKCVDSLQAAISEIKGRGHGNIALAGSSFGGLISIIAAAQAPDVKALALKSPVTEPVGFWKERLGDERINQWREVGTLHYHLGLEDFDLEYGFWEDLQSFNTMSLAPKISCPVLLVHGDKDAYVPITQSFTLARILNTAVRVIQGANHGYCEPGQYAEMKGAIISFLTQQLSGQDMENF